MIPIFEQGTGKGIGHSSKSFRDRFDELCREHIQTHRAKAFALIFYNFKDQEFRKILTDQGVFARLDRLSGTNLSLFYLHSGGRRAIGGFNREFLSRLDLGEEVRLPCVVFFRLKEGQISDVVTAQLESADLIHGFEELYRAIERYIKDELGAPLGSSGYLYWLKGGTRFFSVESFRALLRAALDGII